MEKASGGARRNTGTGVMSGYELPVYDYETPVEIRTGERPRHPIVVVGGGLSGLTLACDLAERGVDCVLLDDDDTIGVRGLASRGPCVARKSLDVFDRLGIVDRIREKGRTWHVGRVLNRDEELYSFDLAAMDATVPAKHPPFTNLQQYYTEWFLVDRIRELGRTELRWKNRVTGVRQEADKVTLTVETPDGPYELDAEWVVAADGANSGVRTAMGIEPEVEAKVDRWCITDILFDDDPFPTERWIWIEAPFNQNRAVWQHQMGDGVWRLDFQMDPDCDPEDVSRPEVAAERVRERVGPDVGFEIVWVGPWAYRTFVLDEFRTGRVFFIGDAAHLMSPFGARGGNSGIQDADNLGWKLALATRGLAPETLLDSYTAERRAAALHNVTVTRRAGRFIAPESRMEARLRRAVLDLSADWPFARALVNGGRLSDPFVYDRSPLVTSGGQAAPNPSLREGGHLLDLLKGGPAFLGLWFAPADGGGAAAMAEIAEEGVPLVTRAVGRPAGNLGCLADLDGRIAAAFAATAGDYVLIRPDQHVAAHLRNATPADVRRALHRATARC